MFQKRAQKIRWRRGTPKVNSMAKKANQGEGSSKAKAEPGSEGSKSVGGRMIRKYWGPRPQSGKAEEARERKGSDSGTLESQAVCQRSCPKRTKRGPEFGESGLKRRKTEVVKGRGGEWERKKITENLLKEEKKTVNRDENRENEIKKIGNKFWGKHSADILAKMGRKEKNKAEKRRRPEGHNCRRCGDSRLERKGMGPGHSTQCSGGNTGRGGEHRAT